MRNTLRICLILFGFLGVIVSSGQEEESADLFTESYTDRFQEVFFEALKQKGIENYDRAEALLLEAKKLDPLNPVIDYELARVLFLEKRYAEAEPYALDALKAKPSEYWVLEIFMQILKRQSKGLEGYLEQLPDGMRSFHLNLAQWYIAQEQWEEAEKHLLRISDSDQADQMRTLIARKKEAAQPEVKKPLPGQNTDILKEGSAAFYENKLREILKGSDWPQLEEVSAEALEVYPLQPYFYYAHGVSLMRQGQAADAVRILETGEGMLLGSSQTSSLIYKSLAEAHSILGNTEKANKYLDKLKSGS
ncbi:MAG: tetratricopeptide repeat protein [Robiginitalea sp.]|jgi:predicted Zn-dependent protease